METALMNTCRLLLISPEMTAGTRLRTGTSSLSDGSISLLFWAEPLKPALEVVTRESWWGTDVLPSSECPIISRQKEYHEWGIMKNRQFYSQMMLLSHLSFIGETFSWAIERYVTGGRCSGIKARRG